MVSSVKCCIEYENILTENRPVIWLISTRVVVSSWYWVEKVEIMNMDCSLKNINGNDKAEGSPVEREGMIRTFFCNVCCSESTCSKLKSSFCFTCYSAFLSQ